jgi:hypothetical protein
MEPSNQDMPTLINFLRTNNYQLQQVEYNPRFGASATAIFEKQAPITELNGNYVNDTTIRLSVDFDTTIDYRNGVEDEEDGMIYNYSQARGQQFINMLMNGTYDQPTTGGKRKGRKGSRKTRKNRRR